VIKLAKAYAWQHVADYTNQLLNNHGTLTAEDKSIMTALRYESLFRLKMYDEMNIEINLALEDIDITVFTSSFEQDTPQNNIKLIHKMDFFVSMQLLLHEVKLMSGHGQDALESLTQLLKWLNIRLQQPQPQPEPVEPELSSLSIISPPTPPPSTSSATTATISKHTLRSRELYWKWHTHCHMVNNYIRCRNWKQALRLLRDMTIDVKHHIDQTSDIAEQSDLIAAQIVLLCRSSKLLLQVMTFF